MSVAVQIPDSLLSVSRIGGTVHFTPHGALTTRETLDALWDGFYDEFELSPCSAIVELDDVDLVNSEAMELLLDIRDLLAKKGATLKLSGATDAVADIFAMTGFFDLVESVDAPVRADVHSSGKASLGEVMLARGDITESQLDDALQAQQRDGGTLGDIVVRKGWLTPRAAHEALAEHLDVPLYDPVAQSLDRDVARLLPVEVARKLVALPLFKVRGNAYVAMSDPRSLPDLQELEDRLECRVNPVLAESQGILLALRGVDGSGAVARQLAGAAASDVEIVESAHADDEETIDRMAAGSPVINLVNGIIQRAVENGASDIHIEPFRTYSRVRMRIDGTLIEGEPMKAVLHAPVVSRLKVMSKLDISERRLPQDGRISVTTRGRSVELRFSSLPGLHGEKVVLRVLDSARSVVELDQLGMASSNLANFRQFLQARHGLILVTGPTGSGKTTTLYSALNELNSIEKNTVTIEDPVEYQLDIINQNEVRAKIGLTFSKILTHVLRQDPDIIMLGEIRDRDTARTAVQAALTGHLVLSTLHTNDAIGAITRMVDMGVEPYLLSSALMGVVGQRLLRRNCDNCSVEESLDAALLQRLGLAPDAGRFMRGRGCGACHQTGYSGRLPIHETLPMDGDLERLIVANPGRAEISALLEQRDHRSLFEDGLARVREGLTTLDELARAVTVAELVADGD